MIAIIDYGMGNLHSVSKAIERLGFHAEVVSNPEQILAAEGVILPGVGAFGDAMQNLRKAELIQTVKQVAQNGTPLLGICLGMQLLFSQSEEHGLHEGLDLLPGKVKRFDTNLKIPHMGWNRLSWKKDHPLISGLEQGHVYFVHSFHAFPDRAEDLLAVTDYDGPVTAIVGSGNIMGMQFHPEKSGELGMLLLKQFLDMCTKNKNQEGVR